MLGSRECIRRLPMLHKILIIAAAIIAVAILLNHFLNGADIDWMCMLILGLVIGHNMRELQFGKIMENKNEEKTQD
jgi:hypothetical protein